jgi:hypothetical protein
MCGDQLREAGRRMRRLLCGFVEEERMEIKEKIFSFTLCDNFLEHKYGII